MRNYHDLQLYSAIEKVHDALKTELNKLKQEDVTAFVGLGRDGHPDPNPYYFRTNQGVLLYLSNDIDQEGAIVEILSTVWGKIELIGSCWAPDASIVSKPVLKMFVLKLYDAAEHIYEVTSIHGVPVLPYIPYDGGPFDDAELIHQTWDQMKKKVLE